MTETLIYMYHVVVFRREEQHVSATRIQRIRRGQIDRRRFEVRRERAEAAARAAREERNRQLVAAQEEMERQLENMTNMTSNLRTIMIGKDILPHSWVASRCCCTLVNAALVESSSLGPSFSKMSQRCYV